MTKTEAQHIATLIQLVNVAQQKGALTLGDAKLAIIAIDALAADVDRAMHGSSMQEMSGGGWPVSSDGQ